MNNRDLRRYDRLTRVQTFGRERIRDFNPTSKAGALFARIDRYLVDVDAARIEQVPNRVDKAGLLTRMRQNCRNITRTAQAIAVSEPDFIAAFKPKRTVSEAAVAAHTDALLAQLESQPTDNADAQSAKQALRDRFIAYEMEAEFVTNLRADREALRIIIQQNQGETQEGIENTAMITSLFDRAGDDIQELNALMINRYQREPEKLKTWRAASRIESAPQRAGRATPATGLTTAASRDTNATDASSR